MLRAFAFAASLIASIALAACDKPPPEGSFGEPQKIKDDGTVRKMEPASTPPQFDDALVLAPSFDVASSTLTVTLKLKPGYHAYAPGEEIGKPVELSVAAPWAIEGKVEVPAGQQKDLGELGKSMILEGDVPLRAKLKGVGEIKGEVTAQVCTDKACDRPKKHAFTVPST